MFSLCLANWIMNTYRFTLKFYTSDKNMAASHDIANIIVHQNNHMII